MVVLSRTLFTLMCTVYINVSFKKLEQCGLVDEIHVKVKPFIPGGGGGGIFQGLLN